MISNKCIYALKAVLELASRERSETLTIGEIARARNIPERFLESIMRELKQAGLADSIRGKKGGYQLAKPAGKITVGQITALFEGPLLAEPNRASTDVLAGVWRDADRALSGILDETTFATLVERERALRQSDATSFSI